MKHPFTGLLFMHGYIADAQLARQLASQGEAAGERPRGPSVLVFVRKWFAFGGTRRYAAASHPTKAA